MDKLIVLLPNSNILQRWDLHTFERELAVNSPIKGSVRGLAMGYASNGPCVFYSGEVNGPGALAPVRVNFLNISTMKLIDFNAPEGQGNPPNRGEMHVRISADGRVLGMWSTSQNPTGLTSLVLTGNSLKYFYHHNSTAYIVPAPDGQRLYTTVGILTKELKMVRGSPSEMNRYLPSYHDKYYLGFEFIQRPRPPSVGQATPEITGMNVSVYMMDNDRPLVILNNLALPADNQVNPGSDFTFDKHIHFIPQAKLIITIPPTNDRLVLHRFDLEEALEKSEVDYLVVLSQPPLRAKKGSTYEYQLNVKSRKGGVKYRIESAPEEMQISSTGKLSWPVSPEFAESEISVIISLRDAMGQEIFHTFQVNIQD
jgi:hypothetical protein